MKKIILALLLITNPAFAGSLWNPSAGGSGTVSTGLLGNFAGYLANGTTVAPIGTSNILSTINGGTGLAGIGTTAINPQTFEAINIGTSVTSLTQNLYSVNMDPINLPHWRAALAKAKSGGGNARLLAVGNSITNGLYSNNSASGDWIALSWPTQFVNMLNAKGLTANSNSTCSTLHPLDDGRITLGSSWSVGATSAGSTGIGGPELIASTTTNALVFTPTVPVDTYRIWYPTQTGLGTFSYQFGSGTVNTQSENSAASFTSVTVNGTLGVTPLNLKYSSGGAVAIKCIEAYNSAQSAVLVNNAGWDGATTSMVNDTTYPYSPGNAMSAYAADLTVIELQTPDEAGGISIATYESNLNALIANAKAGGGDVILITDVPYSIANLSLATQQTYVNALYQVAIANNVPLIDNFDRWQSYEISNPLGYYYSAAYPANVHPVGKGYADLADYNAQSIIGLNGEGSSGSILTAPVYVGTPSITDTGVLLQATSSVAGYNQFIIQNTSAASNASSNYVVNNNNGTATTYYGEFGMNSSGFTGTGSFNLANAVYLDSQSGDLALGTLTNNAIHFVVNNGATDAMYIGTSGRVGIGTATIRNTAVLDVNGSINVGTANPMLSTSTSFTNGAGSSAGTLTNAPAVGNPTKWIPINDNGTTRYIPAW